MRRMTRVQRRQMQSVMLAQDFRMPAPTRGWNAADPVEHMKPGYAIQLDNWIARPDKCEIRKGFKEHATGFASVPETVLSYEAGSTKKMFAFEGGAIYDVTTAGAIGAALVSGLANDRWEAVQINNDAGRYMILVNGEDTPRKFDGTNFSTTAFTGSSGSITLTDENINNLMLHKKQLFLAEKNSLRVWVAAVNAIAGATVLLDLGNVFPKGGVLVGMGVWSGFATDTGPDAVAVFFTDQGEAAIFQGSDPSDANDWFWRGTFAMAKPISARGIFRKDSDLHVVTYDGIIPISDAMRASRDNQQAKSITSKIKKAFASASKSYGTKFGWQAVLYPTGQLAIVNVPITELGRAYQFVQDTQGGAWSRFVNISATAWCVHDGNIFFAGTDGDGQVAVYQWDTGGSDNGTAIQCDLIPAFQDHGTRRIKHYTLVQPILEASASVAPFVDMLTDYRLRQPSNSPESEALEGSGLWGEGEWGVALWTSSNPLRLDWNSASGVGRVGAPRLRIVSNPAAVSGLYPTVRCECIGFNGMYIEGAGLS